MLIFLLLDVIEPLTDLLMSLLPLFVRWIDVSFLFWSDDSFAGCCDDLSLFPVGIFCLLVVWIAPCVDCFVLCWILPPEPCL